jgi:cytochrome P450
MTLQIDSKTLPASYSSAPRVEQDAQGDWHIRGYAEAKELLKEDLWQDGFNAENIENTGLDPVLYQHGEAHRQQRAAIAKYFSPTTVAQKHMPMIEKAADEIIADLLAARRIDLKILTNRMATIVASAVVGLEPTPGLIRRLDGMLHSPPVTASNKLQRMGQEISGYLRQFNFWWFDVRPAIDKRKRNPQDDVISYMLSKNKSKLAIFAECIVYGAAGMATTQEFILVVLMHALENAHMREALSSADQAVRYEALHEILRLEPVIARIRRKAAEPVTFTSQGQAYTIPAGAKINFHVYDVNVDEQATGAEPACLHAHRDLDRGTYRSLIGFGSGTHRCAGEHLAIAETDVFIRKLLAIKSLRVEGQPKIIRNETVEGYEISNYTVTVE